MKDAHHMKHGGSHYAHGGKVHHKSGHEVGSREHHKFMAKHHEKCYEETGSAHHKKMCEHHEKMCGGGMMKKAHGGSTNMRGEEGSGKEIDRFQTRNTIEGNVKGYVSRADTSHPDHTGRHTGEVHQGNGGGYKHGGKAHKAMGGHMTGDKIPSVKTVKYAKGGRATGSSIPSGTNESETRGKIKMGGTIEDNEHYYEETDMHSGRPFSGSKATGGVRMANNGGYARGGKVDAMKNSSKDGNMIDKFVTRNTVEGGDWENHPANTTPKGKSGTKTGEVHFANAGGYKHGGHAAKKHYATGGNVNEMGRAQKMPARIIHPPVANTLQSGTYKRGGKVHHHAEGGREEEPEFSARKLYAQTYMKHGKTIGQSKSAETKAYEAVHKKHGEDVLKKLQAFHKKNSDGYAKGGKS
jgi:hypothetical protein